MSFSMLLLNEKARHRKTHVAYPNTILAVTLSMTFGMASSCTFLKQYTNVRMMKTNYCIILHVKTTESPPFPAHIQEEHIESSLLLLHQFQNALNTETVAWAIWIWGIHGHHEAVPKILITVSSIIQQTYREEQSKSQFTQKENSATIYSASCCSKSASAYFRTRPVLFHIMKADGELHCQSPKRPKKKKFDLCNKW